MVYAFFEFLLFLVDVVFELVVEEMGEVFVLDLRLFRLNDLD